MLYVCFCFLNIEALPSFFRYRYRAWYPHPPSARFCARGTDWGRFANGRQVKQYCPKAAPTSVRIRPFSRIRRCRLRWRKVAPLKRYVSLAGMEGGLVYLTLLCARYRSRMEWNGRSTPEDRIVVPHVFPCLELFPRAVQIVGILSFVSSRLFSVVWARS